MHDISLKRWCEKELIRRCGKIPTISEQTVLLEEDPRWAEHVIIYAVEKNKI